MRRKSDETEYEFLVVIRYRSGHKVEAWFTKFDFTFGKSTNRRAEWGLAESEGNRRFLFLGLEDIESIEQVDARPIKT